MTPTKAQLERALTIVVMIEALEAELETVFDSDASAKSKGRSPGRPSKQTSEISGDVIPAKRKGRGPGKKNKAALETPANEESVATVPEKKTGKKAKRVMSPEAREKIAAAQRKRWAKSKKAGK